MMKVTTRIEVKFPACRAKVQNLYDNGFTFQLETKSITDYDEIMNLLNEAHEKYGPKITGPDYWYDDDGDLNFSMMVEYSHPW